MIGRFDVDRKRGSNVVLRRVRCYVDRSAAFVFSRRYAEERVCRIIEVDPRWERPSTSLLNLATQDRNKLHNGASNC